MARTLYMNDGSTEYIFAGMTEKDVLRKIISERLGRDCEELFDEVMKGTEDALDRQTLKKPIYVDVRFRNHGKRISDGSSLDACYKCPTCGSHIFHVFDSETNCVHCGQALDWRVDNGR